MLSRWGPENAAASASVAHGVRLAPGILVRGRGGRGSSRAEVRHSYKRAVRLPERELAVDAELTPAPHPHGRPRH